MFDTNEERNAYAIGYGVGKNDTLERTNGRPAETIPFDELRVKDVLAYSRETHKELSIDYTEPVGAIDPDTRIWSSGCRDIAVFWIKGSSEGYYVHVEALELEQHLPLIYVKCWDVTSAEKVVRDLSRFIWEEWRN